MTKTKLTPASLRLRAKLTQRQVSIALDRRESTISDWETGKTRPQLYLSEVKLMMQVYKATLDELIEAFDGFSPYVEVLELMESDRSSSSQLKNPADRSPHPVPVKAERLSVASLLPLSDCRAQQSEP